MEYCKADASPVLFFSFFSRAGILRARTAPRERFAAATKLASGVAVARATAYTRDDDGVCFPQRAIHKARHNRCLWLEFLCAGSFSLSLFLFPSTSFYLFFVLVLVLVLFCCRFFGAIMICDAASYAWLRHLLSFLFRFLSSFSLLVR